MLGFLKTVSLARLLGSFVNEKEEGTFTHMIPLSATQSVNVTIVGEAIPASEDHAETPEPILMQLVGLLETVILDGKGGLVVFEKADSTDFRVTLTAALLNH